ncbi:MAG: ACP S-malonyltransferase [Candidatus Brocadiae bacterium]|nr:ACP S-malonyltransferase [Candidatus Brocadiia bacterium]
MSAIGLLFPGQGAQTMGMGQNLAETYSAAREVFDAANEALGLALDRLCFDGPPEELSRTDIAQPAILTVSVAVLRAMAQAGGRAPEARASAGLSLGEYTALVAAGAMEFREAVQLVRHRGLWMQEACEENPGTMCSIIGLEDAQVEQACQTARERTGSGVWPANYNCPGQLVVSGQEAAVQAAAQLCTELGARRTIRLDVAGGFHTQLMKPAAERLAAALAGAHIRRPDHPIVSNVTGQPTEDPKEIGRLLVQQITSPVRWADSMRWFIDQGVEHYYEVGPGRVLRGLLKRTDASKTCLSVSNVQHVLTYAERERR